jgi:hypothetical protein
MVPALRGLPLFLFFCFGQLLGQPLSLPVSDALRSQKDVDCFSEKDKTGVFALQTHRLDSTAARAVRQGLQITGQYAPLGLLVVQGKAHVVRTFARSESDVVRVECWPMLIREEAIVPGHNLYVNRFNALHRLLPDWDGSDIHVSIKEQRFDTTDVDFLGRVGPSPGAAPLSSDHATQMATLVGGSGTSSPRAKGGAPGAILHSSGLFSFLPDPPERYDQLSVSVQNHSYGTDVEHTYNLAAAAYDHSTQLRPGLVHVFSAGNSGSVPGAVGPYVGLSGMANLTGGFKTAKNALVVGASDSVGQVWGYSSRGPCADGRIKPDLVAFGQNGTSDAAALVSAAAAVLQQQILAQTGENAPAALIRAILCASADDPGLPGPDFLSGFGALNVYQAAVLTSNRQYGQIPLEKGLKQSFSIELPPGISLLQLTLAWDDALGSPNAPKALVNDVDGWLTDPNGKIYRPFVKPHQPDSLMAPARPGVDTLNNLEQTRVINPESGTWTLWLDGSRLTTPEQLCTWALHLRDTNTFRWDFPRQSDVLTAGKEALLYWDYQGKEGDTGRFSWRPIGDTIWQSIADTTGLESGVLRWRVPALTTAARLRVETATQVFISDTCLIEPALRLQMGFQCPDSLLFYWPRTAPLNGAYVIYGLRDRYLEPLFVTTDTVVVLNKKRYPQQRFSLKHWFKSGLQGAAAPAPDIRLQGLNCYFSSFYGTLEHSKIELTAILGTLHEVDSIFFEKQLPNGTFSLLNAMAPARTARAEDLQPHRGTNRYRVVLKMSEGHRVFSDTISLLHTGPSLENLFFPNPLPTFGGDLYWVATRPVEGDEVLVLFDVLGRKLLESHLRSDLSAPAFALPSLPPGTYGFTIRHPNQSPLGGVLVVGQ